MFQRKLDRHGFCRVQWSAWEQVYGCGFKAIREKTCVCFDTRGKKAAGGRAAATLRCEAMDRDVNGKSKGDCVRE